MRIERDVADLVDDQLNGEQVTHAYLGVQTSDDKDSGAQVGGLTEDSPAADAGIKTNDVIVEFDGEAIEDSADLSAAVNRAKPGDEIQLTISRDGERVAIRVILGEQPATAAAVQG